jgi:DNA polymerase-1
MLVDTPEAFDRMMRELSELAPGEPIVVDTETDGLRAWNGNRVVGIALHGLYGQADAYYVPFRHAEGQNLPESYLEPLRTFFRGREQVFHNAIFDIAMLYQDGFDIPHKLQDTIAAAHLCNENEGEDAGFGLKPLAVKYLGAGADDAEKALAAELKARKLRGKGQMWKLPAALVEPYACQDVRLTQKLYWERFRELNRWRLVPLFKEVNRYLLALVRMHIRGFQIDRDEIAKQRLSIGPRIEQTRARLKDLAGFDINPNSSKQLQEWLKVTTTNKQYLTDLVKASPREDVSTLLLYRALTKLEGLYLTPWSELADRNDRVHASFSITKVTGRISAVQPNLQQVTKDRVGASVKSCLRADDGSFLVEWDFSTIEPRVASHFCKDPAMLQAFREGKDFHTSIAKRVYNTQDITKQDPRRDRAKTIGLMVLYGGGSYKTAVACGLRHDKMPDGSWAYHYEEAWAMQDGELVKVACSEISREFCTCSGKAWRRSYYDAVAELEPFNKRLQQKAQTYGYLRNPISGRVRRFVGKRSSPFKALNSLIQGASADILRKAVVAIDEELEANPDDKKPKILMVVHDSVVASIPFSDRAEAYVRRIAHLLETTTKLDVPLVVDTKFGPNWGNMTGLA